MEEVESIVADPSSSWKKRFKEMIISMIASNQNELLWYANFLSRCEYEFHFNESFTSAVYFNGNNFVIAINPVILGLIHKDQVIAIFKHSAGHIINHHFDRGNYDESIDKVIVETAKDIVINGDRELPYIKNLPGTGEYKGSSVQALFYQSLREKYGVENYEVGREFEYYVGLMLAAQDEYSLESTKDESCSNDLEDEANDDTDRGSESSEETAVEREPSQNSEENDTNDEINAESNASNSDTQTEVNPKSLSEKTLEMLENGECDIDNHAYGKQREDAIGLDDKVLDSFKDTTLKEMITDSTNFARGFNPREAIEALSSIEKRQSHKDWQKIFNKKMRNYLSNSLRYKEPNKSRQHPIYSDDLDLYGYSPTKNPKLGVVLDVSGSVDDTLLVALMSEIQSIQRKYSIKNVTLVQVDAEIKSIEKFGARDTFIMRHGDAGTIMEPGFDVLLKQSRREIPDMIICATDGDIEQRFEKVKLPSKVQVIWLINKGSRLMFDTSTYPKQQMSVIEFSL